MLTIRRVEKTLFRFLLLLPLLTLCFCSVTLAQPWHDGDVITYSQDSWGTPSSAAGQLLSALYDTIYFSTFGVLEVGLPGPAGFSLRFTGSPAVLAYLPQVTAPGPLDADLLDPTTSSSGALGGAVVALTLNVDFSDYGATLGASGLAFGDLTLCGLAGQPNLNNLTVRQFLAVVNTAIGGGGAPNSFDDLYQVTESLNLSFDSGIPTQFAQEHLARPTTTNHCPTAAALNVSASQGSTANFQLQGTDPDSNPLTYTISQNPAHGTAATSSGGAASYTSTPGYAGSDQFKYKVSDGLCDAEATVDVTVLVVCPQTKRFWKENPDAWPVSATPMFLGTRSYTKTQLLTILNTSIGSGGKVDASVILADQLIPAKLNIASGIQARVPIPQTVASADAAIGGNSIPMGVKALSILGIKMSLLAGVLGIYNSGALNGGCPLAKAAPDAAEETEAAVEEETAQSIPTDYTLEQNYPNPFNPETQISYSLPEPVHARLVVYDVLGREVKVLVDEVQPVGYHTAVWDGKDQSGS
jgi:hypothetical protein